jgi:tape measure domain-containing protein
VSAVDDRIVAMKFDNSKFGSGVSSAIGMLDKLKNSLRFSNQKNGLDAVQNTANKFSMGNVDGQVQKSSGHWSAWRTAALIAFGTVVHQAVIAGEHVIKAFTIAPIMDGFHEYETQLNSVQTILANTGLKGSSGMAQVNSALNNLNTYSDKTIYNFSEMARNIGTFTAAGVKLDTSVASIKGIANVAALSGSNSEQASTAMYQLSQAIANNKVGLQDWNSVVNAGMGGKVMQEALFNMGKMQGTLEGVDAGTTFDQWTKSGNSFRDSLKSGWITGDVLTSTLKAFTLEAGNSYSKAQKQALKAKGFSDAQIAAMQEQARTATDAATKVKTFTQLMGTLKEAVGSGWAQSFGIIFGNFDEAKTLWTGVSQSIGGLISNSAKARNKLLKDWKALGGRKALIDGIQAAFKALGSVVKPIKDAFRDIFPKKTGQDLYNLTVQFRDFMKSLSLSDSTAANLKRTFRGVFALFDIGKQVVSGIFGVLKDLIGVVAGGSGGFLNFTGNIGDMLVAFDQALKKGGGLVTFFHGLSGVLQVPLRVLGAVKDVIFGLFDGLGSSHSLQAGDALTAMGNSLSGLAGIGGNFGRIWGHVLTIFNNVKQQLKPFTDALGQMFDGIKNGFKQALDSGQIGQLVSLLQTGLLAGIALALKKFASGGIKLDVGGGMFNSIKESFEGLTGSMKTMQTQVKANTLFKIAAAVALLTASIFVLSTINGEALKKSLKALAGAFAELLGAMAILTKISGTGGFIKVPIIAASMVMLAAAVLILTLAVKELSKLSWEELKKGLIGVGVLLGAIAVTAVILGAAKGSLVSAGIGMIAIGLGLKVLASAVKDFAAMKWSEMIKGLVGVSGGLLILAGAMRLMPKNLALQGIGILAVALGLKALASAVTTFGSMKWGVMLKGMTGIALALGIIAAAMHAMPKDMIAQAAALVLVSLALKGIGSAVAKMGGMDIKTIAKGLIALGGALLILAGGLHLMSGTLLAAASLVVVAAALALLIPELQALANMSIGDMVRSLAMLAGAFAVLGLTALVLSPLTPALLALGVALLALGAAVALAGVGVLAIGTGLGIMAHAGAGAVSILLSALDGFISRIPILLANLAHGLVSFIQILATNAPSIISALGRILNALMQAIINALPKALELFTKLIRTFITAIVNNAPRIITAALNLVIDFLNAVARKMPALTNAGANLVVAFLNGVGRNIGRIVNAAFRLVVNFLNGLADAIRNNMSQIIAAGGNIASAIVQGVVNGLWNLGGQIVSTLRGIVSDAWDSITDFLGIGGPSKLACTVGQYIVQGLAGGIESQGRHLKDTTRAAASGVVDTMNKTFAKVPNALDGVLDARPRITPVLDLSNVHKDASKIGDALNPSSVSGIKSLTLAKTIATEKQAAFDSQNGSDSSAAAKAKEIQFIQNNYSPKALSPVEVYRKTRNQLSMAKEALNT